MPLIIFPRQLSQRAEFYQQLAQLLAAGITIVKALEILTKNPPARSFREPIRQMVFQLTTGASVTDAWRSLGAWVPSFDIALIDAAEQSGKLDAVFRLLADHYNGRAALLRQVLGDLAYPMFVFHFAIVLFPLITLVQTGNAKIFFLQTLGILVPMYAVIGGLIFAMQGKRGAKWRAAMEQVCRPVPLLGAARKALALSRLAAALEALINAGVGIIEAWELAAAACGSPAILRTVLEWKPRVQSGELPSEAVTAASGVFPEMFANLYHSGEVSGQLDDTLRRLRIFYLEEGSTKLRMLGKIVPQIFYLGVAALVGYKVVTGWMTYFDQVNQASHM